MPEGDDERVVRAASFIVEEGIADIVLLGSSGNIEDLAMENSVALSNVKIINPLCGEKTEEIVNAYYELRKHKGVTVSEARDHVTGRCCMLRGNDDTAWEWLTVLWPVRIIQVVMSRARPYNA